MIALDTNLPVYAHRAAAPEHRAARRALERAASDAAGWGIALPSLAEFWAVVTHPAARARPSTPAEAAGFLAALAAAGAQVWLPGPGFADRLCRLAASTGVGGPRVFDSQIALIAREAGAREIWTHGRAFHGRPALPARDPLGD